MKNDDFTLLNSCAGSVTLPLLFIAILYLMGSEPLWLPMKGGGEEVNYHYLNWLLAAVPFGSLLGCLLSFSFQQKEMSLKTTVAGAARSWCLSLIAGFVALYCMVSFIGSGQPLAVCGVGLAFASF